MEIFEAFLSLDTIAIVALIGTVLFLLFELRHLFFRKKPVSAPEIPDFDASKHTSAQHATEINVDHFNSGQGINGILVFILVATIALLTILIFGGFLRGKKPVKPTVIPISPSPVIPTEIIEIQTISPTSPFTDPVEVPFNLSGTPAKVTPTNEPTGGAQGGDEISTPSASVSITSASTPTGSLTPTSVTNSSQTVTATASPTLPVSGNIQFLLLLTLIPLIFLTIMVLI